MILGFTGTRHSPTDKQLSWLWQQFDDVDEFHHGACVGADAAAHQAAIDNDVIIVVHPPTNKRLMMPEWEWSQRDCIYIRAAKDYHARNQDIVHAADQLIALPDGPRRPHGGTWYTIDYAIHNHVPVTICYPDGTIEHIDPSNPPGVDDAKHDGGTA